MNLKRMLLGLTLSCVGVVVHAQGWSPQKNVEIVVGSAPGGSNDKTARTVERILIGNRLISNTLTVVNKIGRAHV